MDPGSGETGEDDQIKKMYNKGGKNMNLDMTSAIVGALVAVIPVIGKFIIDLKTNKSSINQQELKTQSTVTQEEFRKIMDEARELRNELKEEILKLKSDIQKYQEINLRYAIENAEFRTTLRDLRAENAALQKKFQDLGLNINGNSNESSK